MQHPQGLGKSRGTQQAPVLQGTAAGQGSWGHRGQGWPGGSSWAGREVRRCWRCTDRIQAVLRADVQTAKAALPQGTGQDQPFPVSTSFCAVASRSRKPGVPRMASQGHRRPARSRPGAPSPGSSQGLCKQGGLGGTRARAAATPRPAAQLPAPASGTLVGFVPFGLGLLPPLCEESLLVVAFALELAVGGQVLRLRPLAAVHLHLRHGTGRRRQWGSAAPSASSSPGLFGGQPPPPEEGLCPILPTAPTRTTRHP